MATNKRLPKNERADLVASLEHIVTVGCSKRDDVKRQRAASLQDTDPTCSHQERQLKHAEDVRLYETKGVKHQRKDAFWEEEYGDELDLYSFYQTSRRTLYRPHTNSRAHVPREIVLRCWERAVQAASNQIIINVEEDNSSKFNHAKEEIAFDQLAAVGSQRLVDSISGGSLCEEKRHESSWESIEIEIHEQEVDHEESSEEITKRQLRTPEEAIRKCRELKIASVEAVCLRCQIVFDSVQQCHMHFYGTATVLGCCWQLVKEQEIALMRTLMEAEVKAVTDLCTNRVVNVIQSDRKMDWQQVLSAIEIGDADPLLPSQVVENITKRVRQRYANLPF